MDTTLGIGPEIAAALGLCDIELAALLPTDPRRSDKLVLSVLHHGTPVAVAQLAPAGSNELQNELSLLRALETCALNAIVVPVVLASFSWCELDVVLESVLESAAEPTASSRDAEMKALGELVSLTDSLRHVVPGTGEVLYTATSPAGTRRRFEMDASRSGTGVGGPARPPSRLDPLECPAGDPVRRPAGRLVRSVLAPTPALSRALSTLGSSAAEAPAGLERYLRSSELPGHDVVPNRASRVRREMLGLLTGRA